MFDLMKQEYGYETFQQCFRDRHNHRKFWHDEISKFNTHDKTRLARAMLEKYNTYDGMRCPFELTGSFQQDLFNYIYWVDAGDRKPKEPEDSMKISFDMVLNHPDRRAFLIFVDNSQEGKGNIVFKGVRKKSYYPYTPIISTIYL